MPRLTQEVFKRVKQIYGAFNVSTSEVTKAINGRDCTIHVLSGSVWVNPNDTAVADDTSIKMTSGMVLDINCSGNLSLISDATGSTVQIIVWEE